VATDSPSARVRARLAHPVIDADGHTVEFWPALAAYVREEGLRPDPDRPLSSLGVLPAWGRLTPSERAERRCVRTPWWAFPAKNTLDLATATLPALLHARLDELGIDFAVAYPSLGLVFLHLPDDEARRATCRALNRYHADVFRDLRDRLEPVAVIPMQTPAEAIEELEHAVRGLGFKAVLLGGYAVRTVPSVARAAPTVADHATWLDAFGLDSPFDYDPVWAKCAELGVSVAAHSVGMGWGSRRSISSYVYNHIGNFAAAGEMLARSLFLGGVTRRFPSLRFAFLEGGVAWGRTLYGDLISHWEKRNRDAVQLYNPVHVDRALFGRLLEQYGGELLKRAAASGGSPGVAAEAPVEDAGATDDFAACEIGSVEDLRNLFVPRFFFGCEADDPLTALAFDRRLCPGGVRLNALFGSDIGHWDVPDAREVLAEAFALVDRGLLSREDFRDFSFANAARFYLETNPDFFRGTRVEDATRALFQ